MRFFLAAAEFGFGIKA